MSRNKVNELQAGLRDIVRLLENGSVGLALEGARGLLRAAADPASCNQPAPVMGSSMTAAEPAPADGPCPTCGWVREPYYAPRTAAEPEAKPQVIGRCCRECAVYFGNSEQPVCGMETCSCHMSKAEPEAKDWLDEPLTDEEREKAERAVKDGGGSW